MGKKKAHLHSERDNIAVALVDLKEGDVVIIVRGDTETPIKIREAVPFGHKFAIEEIRAGGEVTKYGGFIGKALRDIGRGDHVHVHNIKGVKYT